MARSTSKEEESQRASDAENSDSVQESEEWASSDSGADTDECSDTNSGGEIEDSEVEAQAAKSLAASAKPETLNPYEAQRQANIERNLALFRYR